MNLGLAEAVWESELTPRTLAGAIERAWAARFATRPAFALDGATRTADLVAALAAKAPPRPTAGPESVG